MGTRGVVGWRLNNKLCTTYNHWDSYPSGLGQDIVMLVEKINSDQGWETFKKNAAKVQLVEQSGVPSKKLVKKYKNYSDTGVSTGKLTEWYCLLRTLQGAPMLHEIYKGNVEHMLECTDFEEYAYILNLDENKLECYNGNALVGKIPFAKVSKKKLYSLYGEEDFYNG